MHTFRLFVIISLILPNLLSEKTVAQSTFQSTQSGAWNEASTWGGTGSPTSADHVIISSNHTVTLAANTSVVDLEIEPDATLLQNNKDLTIKGNYTNNGFHSNLEENKGHISFENTSILDGNGSVSQFEEIKFNSSGSTFTFATSASLTLNCPVNVDQEATFINNGTISFFSGFYIKNNKITSWTNAAGSTLNVTGAFPTADLTLNASAVGNTINFISSTKSTLYSPSSATYYNLKFTGGTHLELTGSLIVDGDLSIDISSALDLSSNPFTLSLRGDWQVEGTFIPQNNALILDGTADQTLKSDYIIDLYNLTVNKSSGKVILDQDIIVSNQLTLNQGTVKTGSHTLSLGTSTTSTGLLSYNSGKIIGQFRRWIGAATSYTFPVGAKNGSFPLTSIFTDLTAAGTVTVRFFNTHPGKNGLPISEDTYTYYNTFSDGYWQMTAGNGLISTNYSLDLDISELTGFPIQDDICRIAKMNESNTTWAFEGLHVSTTSSSAQRSGFNGFGKFTLVDNTNCAPPTTEAISGDTEVCSGETGVSYSVSNTSGSTYAWSVSGGTIGSGQGTNSITIDWDSSGETGEVEVLEQNSCTFGDPVSINIIKKPLAPDQITGRTILAENTFSETYSVDSQTGYNYNWIVNGGTISFNNGSTIMVDWGSAGIGSVSVYASNNSCPSTNSDTLTINVTKFVVFVAQTSGDWDNDANWVGGSAPTFTDNARIPGGITMTMDRNTSINHLIIEGTLNQTGNKSLTVSGNYELNGTHNAGTQGELILGGSGSGLTLEGNSGIFTGEALSFQGANRTVVSGSELIFDVSYGNNPSLVFSANGIPVTIINDGAVSFLNSQNKLFSATENNASWVNNSNSTLITAIDFFDDSGILYAAADNNTVVFKQTVSGILSVPNNGRYYHLQINSSDALTFNGNLDIEGNLTISGNSIFTAGGTYNLSLAGNWTNESANTFVPATSTVLFDGNTDQVINFGTGTENFYNLTVNKSNGNLQPATNTSLQILSNGYLDFVQGLITLDQGAVIFQDDAFSNGGDADSYVTGIIQKYGDDNFLFPTGAGSSWGPVRVDNTQNGTVSDIYEAQYFDTTPANTENLAANLYSVSLNEYWDVNRANGSSVADLTFYWKDAQRSGITDIIVNSTAGDLIVSHYNSIIGQWENMTGYVGGSSAIGPGGQGDITIYDINSFSPFTFASANGDNALPAEIIQFSAYSQGNKVLLNWQTSFELNNDYFSIERSADGMQFKEIGTIDAAGNSNQVRAYQFTDQPNSNGMLYYRLKQTDLDGSYKYSKMTSVNLNKKEHISTFELFPNPARDSFTIKADGLEPDKKVWIELINPLGVSLHSAQLNTTKTGCIRYEFDKSANLKPGLYFITINTDKSRTLKQLLIQ